MPVQDSRRAFSSRLMYDVMTSLKVCIGFVVILTALAPARPIMEQAATLQSLPPNVSLTPTKEKATDGANIHINAFLTNSLLHTLAEESDNKKRVQRYRAANRLRLNNNKVKKSASEYDDSEDDDDEEKDPDTVKE